jgi:hypothetical protein
MEWVVKATPRPLYSQGKKKTVRIVNEAGWAKGLVLVGAKISPPPGFFCSLFALNPYFFVLIAMAFTFSFYLQYTQNKQPCPRQDSNPQSQQASAHRPTP